MFRKYSISVYFAAKEENRFMEENIVNHQTKQRSPSLDIIRCFALFFVVSVHFFLNNGYYNETIAGTHMYIMTVMRSFFMICVPLFIVLSGYLMCNKTISKSYYKKLVYTVSIYFLASVCCFLYKGFVLNQSLSLFEFFHGFFGYFDAPYAWYVEMYIGLFLMCPFLNLIYNNLNSQQDKKRLLGTFLLITALPNVTNIFVFDIAWFLSPSVSTDYFKIVPAYWVILYPVTYYFIGCYLREYKLKLSCKTLLCLSILMCFINGTFNYYRSYNNWFVWGIWQEHGSLPVVIQTVLFFAFWDNMKYTRVSARVSRHLAKISDLCFGAYLVSWIFDDIFYKALNRYVPTVQLRLYYYPLIVPLVYICSLFMSFIINKIYNMLAKLISHNGKQRDRVSECGDSLPEPVCPKDYT